MTETCFAHAAFPDGDLDYGSLNASESSYGPFVFDENRGPSNVTSSGTDLSRNGNEIVETALKVVRDCRLFCFLSENASGFDAWSDRVKETVTGLCADTVLLILY